MSIRFECFGCGRTVNVRDSIAGKRIRCPACSANLDVPLEQPIASPIPRHRPATDTPKRKSQRPDPQSENVDVRPDGGVQDREHLQPIGMFTYRDMVSTNPGRLSINPFLYWYCFPFWPTVLLIGTLVFTYPAITVHYSWSGAAFMFALAKFLYWLQIVDHFRCGCLCPAVVISRERQLVAVYTDLSSGYGSYPAVKVLRQPLRRMPGGVPPKGTRLAAIAFYSQGNDPERFKTCDPKVVNCATTNQSKLNKALKSIADEEWKALLAAVETHLPTSKMMICLWKV